MMDVRATMREIREPAQRKSCQGDFFGLELRIDQGGELMSSEVFKTLAEPDERSETVRAELEAKGWTAMPLHWNRGATQTSPKMSAPEGPGAFA